MKKLVKEICRLENLKSEVKVGNVREIISIISSVFASYRAVGKGLPNGSEELIDEFNDFTNKKYEKARKKLSRSPNMTTDELVKYLLGRK